MIDNQAHAAIFVMLAHVNEAGSKDWVLDRGCRDKALINKTGSLLCHSKVLAYSAFGSKSIAFKVPGPDDDYLVGAFFQGIGKWCERLRHAQDLPGGFI